MRSLLEVVPPGTILHYAGREIPANYLECNGQAVDKNVYPNLFDAIGYIYGGEERYFNVPDLQNIFIRGYGKSERPLGEIEPDGVGKITSDNLNIRIKNSGYHNHGCKNNGFHNHDILNGGAHRHQYALPTTNFDVVGVEPEANNSDAVRSPSVSFPQNNTSINGEHDHHCEYNGTHNHEIQGNGTHSHEIVIDQPTIDSDTRPTNMVLYFIIKT